MSTASRGQKSFPKWNLSLMTTLLLAILIIAPAYGADKKIPQKLVRSDVVAVDTDIPQPVKDATTYRIMPLHIPPIWAPREDLAEILKAPGFDAQFMREFYEDYDNGALWTDPESPYSPELLALLKAGPTKAYIALHPGKKLVPVIHNDSGTAFVARGDNMLFTHFDLFDDCMDDFAEVLVKIEQKIAEIEGEGIKLIHSNKQQGIKETLAEVNRVNYRNRFTQAEIDELKANAHLDQRKLYEKFRSESKEKAKFALEIQAMLRLADQIEQEKHADLDDDSKEKLLTVQLSALSRLWRYPVDFMLFDKNGAIVYAPNKAVGRKAYISYLMHPEVFKISHAAFPEDEIFPSAQPDFLDDLNKVKWMKDVVEDMYDTIVIGVHGVQLVKPLKIVSDPEAAQGDMIYTRGYPAYEDRAVNPSDGMGEYVATGKSLLAARYMLLMEQAAGKKLFPGDVALVEKSRTTGVTKEEIVKIDALIKGPEWQEMLTMFNLFGLFNIYMEGPTNPGFAGAPYLNAKGEVVGMVGAHSADAAKVRPFSWGTTSYMTMGLMETYQKLKEGPLQDPEVMRLAAKITKDE